MRFAIIHCCLICILLVIKGKAFMLQWSAFHFDSSFIRPLHFLRHFLHISFTTFYPTIDTVNCFCSTFERAVYLFSLSTGVYCYSTASLHQNATSEPPAQYGPRFSFKSLLLSSYIPSHHPKLSQQHLPESLLNPLHPSRSTH